MQTMVTGAAQWAAVSLVFLLAFFGGTYISWQALGVLKWEKFVFDPLGHQTRMLRFLVSMFFGLLVAVIIVAFMLAAQFLRVLVA